MNTNLWTSNHPRNFWQCQPLPSDEIWHKCIVGALPFLDLPTDHQDVNEVLTLTLGEARFGPNHWRLSFPKRAYYFLKPLLPRALTRLMRRIYQKPQKATTENPWPVEERYIQFLWNVLTQILRENPSH